nr:MAG: hypothetical protein H3Bulk42508_000002 [Mitovirus sp.]
MRHFPDSGPKDLMTKVALSNNPSEAYRSQFPWSIS